MRAVRLTRGRLAATLTLLAGAMLVAAFVALALGSEQVPLGAIAGTQSAEHVSGYAKRVAEELSAQVPGSITAKMAKAVRPGRVFIDWSQNAAAKTTVAPYSLRAQPTPTVSTPLTWAEVEAIAVGDQPVRQYSAGEVLDRVDIAEIREGLEKAIEDEIALGVAQR